MAFGVCPPSTTRRTIISRPAGVSRAFLCTSIRFPQGSPKLRQLQHPRSGPNGQPVETSQLEPDASAVKFDDVDANGRAQIEGAVAVNLSNHIVNRPALVRGNLVQRL